jgi:hypothetical protein
MESARKEKIRIYRELINILDSYGITRAKISLHKNLVKDFSFNTFELLSLSIEIGEKLSVPVHLPDAPNLEINAIIDGLHSIRVNKAPDSVAGKTVDRVEEKMNRS